MAALPADIHSSARLRFLDLHGCSHLKALPDTITQLPLLQELVLRDCRALQALPEEMCGLASLQVLDLRGCSSLSALPDTFGYFERLQSLYLTGCTKLTMLPQSVWKLRDLRHYWPPSDGSEELPFPVKDPIFRMQPDKQTPGDRFAVLSIDGGGMRGLIPGG